MKDKYKLIYIFFSICAAFIFLIHLGGLNSWAQDPIVLEQDCFPNITKSSTDPNIILPTLVSSVEDITIVFFGQYSMNPDTTKAAFHLYAGEDENIDLKEEENLVIVGKVLTYTHSSIEEGIIYTVKIESTATDTEGNPLDGNYSGMGGEETVDDWVMKFVIDGVSPGIGWSQIYDPNTIFTEDKVSGMIVDSQGWLWVSTDEGDICYFDGNSWSDKTPSVDPAQIDEISCMAVDNEGCVWIGLNVLEGADNVPKLAKWVNNTWEVKDLDNIPSNEFIKDIAVDSEDNIWIIASVGILKYHNGQLENCTPPGGDGPLSGFIISLIIDPNDNLWIRTVSSEIWQPDVEGGWWGDEYIYDSSYEIRDMAADSSGNIWVGTDNGLLKLDPSGQNPNWFKYTNTDGDGLPADSINALCTDPNNGLVWVGTSGGLGKFFITSEYGIAYTGDNASEISDEAVTQLAMNNRGEIWFGTVQGIQMRDEISPCILENQCIPANGAIVDISQNIRVVFSEPVNHGTAESAFTMIEIVNDQEGQSIQGEFSWLDAQTLVFDPNAIVLNRSYKVEIDANADVTDMLGNLLNESYIVLFSTSDQEDVDPPYIDNQSCSLTQLTFNVNDDGVGVDPNSIEVTIDGEDVTEEVQKTKVSINSYQVTYSPDSDFIEDVEITVTVTAEDLFQNQLLDHPFQVTPQEAEVNTQISIPLSGSGCFIDTLKNRTKFLW